MLLYIVGSICRRSGSSRCTFFASINGCAKDNVRPRHEQRVVLLELGVVNSVESWAVDHVFEWSFEKPFWENLKINVSSFVQDVKAAEVNQDGKERQLCDKRSCNWSNSKQDSVSKSLANFKRDSGSRFGVDRLVMVLMPSLVQSWIVERTMEKVIDKLDERCMEENVPS